MAYFTPYIDSAGLHIPTYADIRDQLIDEAKNIFGNDIYLEIDSADYQFISVFALKTFDSLQAIQLAYNNRGPQTAIGSGLDGVVLMNGIARLPASYSTCQVGLVGSENTTIANGVVRDINNNLWDLPSTCVIPVSGTVDVSATCRTPGNVTAPANSITGIVTPTAGWISVSNEVDALPGKPPEVDSSLRARQAISVALPSQTLLEGTNAAILSVSNVSRTRVYENDTNRRSSEGFPPHSITAVVEGGTDAAIAEAIFYHKGIGGYTNGTTEIVLYDIYNQPNTVRFYRPVYVPVFVTVNVKMLSGWNTSLSSDIKIAVANYLNTLNIGEDVVISSIWGTALSKISDLRTPEFSILSVTAGKFINVQSPSDLPILFYEAAQGSISRISVSVT